MSIMLSPDLEARLREKAAREGSDANSVAETLLRAILDREVREQNEAEAVPREFTPLSEVIMQAQAKHGFPASWPFGSEYALTEADWAEIEASAETADETPAAS